MRRSALLLAFPFTLCLNAAADSAEPSAATFPGVEKLMSEREYHAAGLDKLAPEEREALNRWLMQYTRWSAPAEPDGPTTPTAAPSAAPVAAVALSAPEEPADQFRAHIKPPFSGWSGSTRFYLDNGQVWEQRRSGRFSYSGDDTEVLIRKNFLGFYMLEHVASGESVGVKKIN